MEKHHEHRPPTQIPSKETLFQPEGWLEYDPTSGYPVETDSGPCFYVTNTQSFDPINDVDLAIKYFLDVAEGKEVLKKPGRQCIDLCDPPEGTTAYVVS